MNFPELFTIWVVRNDVPFFVGVKSSMNEAIEWGNKTVSTREFLVKSYICKETASPQTVPVIKPEVVTKPELDLSKLGTISIDDD